MSDTPYTFWQRQLHRLALGSRMVTEFSLDLELGRNRVDADVVAASRHVFIAGLARAGTTIMLRRLYASGHFSGLTYRDMPFVLMPLFWKRLTGASAKSMKKTERAHGDGLMVDYDSPEAFEEVFWKTVCGPEYIRKDRLLPHQPDSETLDKFKRYIGLILKSRGGGADRYISKNNNNILRLDSLCKALPESLFVVPFRSPRQHALSLLRQHRRFLVPGDGFTPKYMKWLGHHEFGASHRPFYLTPLDNPYSADSLAYWLRLWNDVYEWLAAVAPESVVFISYEKLCTDMGQTWQHLLALAEADEAATEAEPLHLKPREIEESVPQNLLSDARRTHQRLLERHEQTFAAAKRAG